MKKHKMNFKILCCVILSLSLYTYICVIFTPKSINDLGGKNYYGGMGFLAEPENSLDVIMYGNSDVYSGFIPALMYEKYGFSSYASGVQLQSIKKINHLLKATLKKQKPKIVILEVDCLYDKDSCLINNNNLFLASVMYHTRWKELKLRDFYTLPNRKNKYDITKGYEHSNYVYKFNPGKYMGHSTDKPAAIPAKNIKQLKFFLNTCSKKNIKVIFLELPSSVSWTYAKHNYISKIASENDIAFIDLNIPNSNYQADFQNDFRDNGNHLNVYGAKKTTTFIGDFIEKKYKNIIIEAKKATVLDYWRDVVSYYYEQLS